MTRAFIPAIFLALAIFLSSAPVPAESIADSLTFERWCSDRNYAAERCNERRPEDVASFEASRERIRRMEIRNDRECEDKNRKLYELECGEMFDRSGVRR